MKCKKRKERQNQRQDHVKSQNRSRLESITRIAKDSMLDNSMDNQEQVTRNVVTMLVNISKLLSVNVNDWIEDTHDTDDAYIVRRHKDTWCSVRMGDYMFLLCVGAAGGSDTNPSVLIVNMETGKIIFRNDSEIIDMIRETSEVEDNITDDDLMFDYARNEYI